jgi:hypothetical protein
MIIRTCRGLVLFSLSVLRDLTYSSLHFICIAKRRFSNISECEGKKIRLDSDDDNDGREVNSDETCFEAADMCFSYSDQPHVNIEQENNNTSRIIDFSDELHGNWYYFYLVCPFSF